MNKAIAATANGEVIVNMGQIAAGQTPARMKAVLGSCVGLAFYHARLRKGILAHVVLADSAGRDGPPGKFADTAVPFMLKLLSDSGVPTHGLTAKFAGGANMFGNGGPLKVGEANVEAVTRQLQQKGIRLAGTHVGGNKGRRIIFDCSNGELTVQIAGIPDCVL